MNENEEFKILKTKRKRLNKKIQEFREENPNYEIFNITVSEYTGVVNVWVILRLKK